MKKSTSKMCILVATIALFVMGACVGCGETTVEKHYLQIGDKEYECENQECATVNFMVTDNGAVSNSIPVGSSLDGYKPCRVDIQNPNRIISDWTDVKGGSIPFTGKASDGLTLYPIWADCTIYSDRTPVGYWDKGVSTSTEHEKWSNLQPEQWKDYEECAKYYRFQLKGSSCILIDFSEVYKDTDVIEMTVEMSVNKLYLIGVEDTTFETKIKINARSTELHIYMDNMLMKSRDGAPVIDTSSVNFEVVTIEAAGNCALTGVNSSAIQGDIIAITGRNGTYTITGGDCAGDKIYSGIDCNRVNINNTKVIVKGGKGVDGNTGGSWDNAHGGPGGHGGAGGHAITVNNQIELFKCVLDLNGGKGGNGGSGGRGNNSAFTIRNGGPGGNGGTGGNMLNFTNNVSVKLNEKDAFINGEAGEGGNGGVGGVGGGYENSWKRGDKGANGSSGQSGLSVSLIKKEVTE